jgi:hypothetical protein
MTPEASEVDEVEVEDRDVEVEEVEVADVSRKSAARTASPSSQPVTVPQRRLCGTSTATKECPAVWTEINPPCWSDQRPLMSVTVFTEAVSAED